MPPRLHSAGRLRRLSALVAAGAVLWLPGMTSMAQELGGLRGQVDENALGLPRRTPAAGTNAAGAASPVPGSRPAARGLGETDLSVQLSGPELPDDEDEDEIDEALLTGSIEELIEADRLGRAERAQPVGVLQEGVGSIDADPFAPLGLRLGTFDARVTLDLGVTAQRTRNTVENAGPPVTFSDSISSGFLGEAALSLEAASDWSRHGMDLTFDGRLPLRLSGDEEGDPSFDADASLRLDLGTDTTLTGSVGYSFTEDDPASAAVTQATDPLLFPGVTATNEPGSHAVRGALALSRQAGPLAMLTEVNAQRQIYGSADLSNGTRISQSDLDFTRYGGRLRAGYAISPVLTPFVEAEYSQRVMDERPDSGGIDRNATRYALRTGIQFDRGDKLNGEFALGYVREDLADVSLEDIGGLSVSAALNWSPRRETDIGVGLSTTTTSSGDDDVSGAVVYAGQVGFLHRARANLQFDGEISVEYEDVTGNAADTTTVAGFIGATYWFNRFMGMTGRVGHERTFSADAGEQSDTSNAFIGLRLQR